MFSYSNIIFSDLFPFLCIFVTVFETAFLERLYGMFVLNNCHIVISHPFRQYVANFRFVPKDQQVCSSPVNKWYTQIVDTFSCNAYQFSNDEALCWPNFFVSFLVSTRFDLSYFWQSQLLRVTSVSNGVFNSDRQPQLLIANCQKYVFHVKNITGWSAGASTTAAREIARKISWWHWCWRWVNYTVNEYTPFSESWANPTA